MLFFKWRYYFRRKKGSAMVDMETARQIALALPGTVEVDHFGMPSFRVNNKIYSTLG